MKFTGERIIPDENFCSKSSKAYLEHEARYNFASKFVNGMKILDIACGTGYGSNILFNSGGKVVYGCDISSDAIEYAKKKYGKESINFETMNATNLDFPDNEFDCVVSFETIEHISDYKLVLKEFHRVLKNDGILIISTPNKDISSKGREKPSNPFHFNEFTIHEFSNLLDIFFNDVTLYSQLLAIPVGTLKNLARKILHFFVKLDFLKLHTKLLSEQLYTSLGNIADNTNQEYEPILFEKDQNPVILIAVCKKITS